MTCFACGRQPGDICRRVDGCTAHDAPFHSSQPTPIAKTPNAWADEYITMLDDCESRESRLTDWERGFVDSLRRQIEDGRRPSAKQTETLDNVWEKATARG